jgi:hypothetical protein
MTFDDSVEEAAFRAEARAWLDANAPTHLYTALVAAAARPELTNWPPGTHKRTK